MVKSTHLQTSGLNNKNVIKLKYASIGSQKLRNYNILKTHFATVVTYLPTRILGSKIAIQKLYYKL